jgi:amino acid adenylation domain-containing protein
MTRARSLTYDVATRDRLAPSIPQHVEALAAAHPGRVAVVSEHGQLTYGELVRRVQSLAAVLRERYGVGRESFVALLLERRSDMPVAILAVMSAGGICVPLDPSHPEARLRFMLEDCGSDLLVTNVDAPAALAAGRRVLDLRTAEAWTADGAAPAEHGGDDDGAGYCLYTSGSTGQPKGVLLKHHGIRNVLSWARDYWRVLPSDGFLQKTTFTFDISIVEMFLPLVSGARLIQLPPGAERWPATIRDAIVEQGATIVQFTPSGLATYLATVGDDPLPGVSRCLAAGEPLKPALRDAFFDAVDGCGLYNLYGPTETTIYATAADVPRTGAITVGAPLPNTTLRILGEDGRPCADGDVGEIWIGGAGVAGGYLNRPDLTEQRFLEDPLAPGRQHYRSGDLGLLLPSGEVDVRGRLDHQVKIRGYRIELGEIESALAALGGVRDAAIVAVELNGQRELVAYWIGDGDPRTLAEGLGRTLPGYMVPSRFVRMDAFPLTSSGKVQRDALPSPELGAESSGSYVAPANALDAAVCAILEEVLGWGRVGLADRFLDLGGDSLKAVRVVLLLQQRLERSVEIEALLRNETIAQTIAGLTRAPAGPVAVQPAPDGEWHPLASGQRGLWLLEQGGTSHAAYTEPLIFELSGPLDAAALRRAVRTLVSRHESLRTAIEQIGGGPMQRVVSGVEPAWWHETIADAAQLDRRLAELVALDFDLAAGRLLHGALIERAPDEHVFVLTLHHIATDGLSLTLLIDELVTAYNAYRGGEDPALAPMALQFKDYAHWQQQRLRDGSLSQARDYWTRKLTGVEPLDLPADRPRLATRSYRGATIATTVAPDALAALEATCHDERTTVYAGLCAVLRVLLYRYTGQRDFTLGTSLLGRPVPELDRQLGYYVNTVALRDDVAQGANFRAVLRATRTTLLEALRHAEYPFDRVVDDLGASTSVDRNPFFDVMIMEDPGWGDPRVTPDGLRMRRRDAPNAHSKLDLTLFFKKTDAGLRVTAEYSTDIFDADRVERLLEHFETLLRAAVARPDADVDTLAVLPEHERRRVLVEFNDTDVDVDLDTPVHVLFEQQARRVPERVATVDEHGALTFAELDARANALAWTLRDEHGIRSGELVALLMERGVHMTVAILGVLKAGGVYVPISTKDPAERIEAVLDDSGARVLLTDDPQAAATVARDRVVLDVTGELAPRSESPPAASSADSPAYCIYTSGSTGVPNGVLVEHRSLVNRLRWMVDDLDLAESDVFLQKTPYAFDVSVWELLAPGMLGARQVMLRPGGEGDPHAIREAIDEHGVTIVHFVPSMLEQYLAAEDGGLAGVRHCVCSGEALGDALAARFFDAVAGTSTRLHNYYGPTEATIDVSLLDVEEGRPVTIGRPAPNTRLYVLDASDRPSPIGVTGELCIAGVQVGRGYLHRPQLTAQRFTADPFRSGERMYRTGDVARWQPDGELRYLGRRDGQVKLRGFRVELGEIEHALRQQAGVDAAVVLLRRDAAGPEYLCAYVAGARLPATERLRAAVRSRLPEHMTPSHYVALDAVPVTRNGKVDRTALLAIGPRQPATGVHVEPRTDVERRLLDIWLTLLPAADVGVSDDFFLVGGNSLSALQLSARITQDFGVAVRLAEIFEHRTVADLASMLAAAPREPAAPRAPARLAPRRRAPGARHPLSFAQERLWFLHKLDPDSGAYHIRLLAKLTGALDAGVMRLAVGDLVERHEMLRTTFVDAGDGAYQTVRSDLPLPFELRDLGAMPGDEPRERLRRAAQEVTSRPFALAEEAALRVVLFRVSDDEHHLLVVVHHLAADGWSLRLLIDELSVLYSRHRGEPVAPLAPLALTYVDHVEALRDPVNEAAVDDDVDYWMRRLGGSPTLTLATDVPTAGSDDAASAVTSLTLARETTRRIRELAAATRSTPFEITMATLNLLLSRLAGQQDVVVGFPVTSRRSVELEQIVGVFLNTLALRTDLSGAPTFTELLRRVSDGVREAYDHQDAPFELLVERLNPVRSLDHTPVFEVLLNYQEELHETLAIEGVEVEIENERLDVEAKFALVFYVLVEGDRMHVDMAHRPGSFSAARARTILDQLGSLLAQVCTLPDDAIATFSLATPDAGGLDRPIERPAQAPVTELVAAHATARPDAPAVVQGAGAVGYGELVTRAEALARDLVARGTRPGDVVAVTGPRGIGFVVGLLGVLRSGATAFPLDPALPEGRRRHLVALGAPTRVVAVDGAARNGDALPVVQIAARDGRLLDPADAGAVELPAVREDAPAYLFFTSGTTGAPRGVLGWHGALSHFLTWQRDAFGVSPDDRCAQTTSASFDVMLRDTLLALVSGATVVVPEPADETGGRALLGWVERQSVTVLHAAPTVFQSWLLDAAPGLRLAALRLLFLAGEPLKASLVEDFRAAYPDSAEIVNLYGPTETTLAKFAYRVPHEPLPPVLPVGDPLPQCQGIVMRDGVVCGVGEPGEIVIRTPFRSLGYLDDGAATSAAFIRNPRRDDEHDLLYRSGDVGRLRPDGVLEILGRSDHQVKINGVRIQPAEVEHALQRHPQVATCLVNPVRDRHGEAHLVAYVVARTQDPALAQTLRAYLSDRLAPAMVPAQHILLDRIPTTPNGKPDRAALPEPRLEREVATPPAQAPSTPAQLAVAGIWSEVLGRATPGVRDNFFELGGTSLKLLRLHSSLEASYPGAVRVAQLFAHPTVAGQAALVAPGEAPAATEEEIELDF